MQRRKLPQCVRTKPKLVIQRPSCLANSDNPSKLGRSISILKMATINKQNEQPEPKQHQRRSLVSIRRESAHQRKLLKPRSSAPIIHINGNSLKENSYISDGLQPNLDYKGNIEDSQNQIVAENGKNLKRGKVVGFEVELQQLLRKTLWLESEGKSKFQVYHSANCKIRELFQRTQLSKYDDNLKNSCQQKRTCQMGIQKCLDQSFLYKQQTLTNNSINTVNKSKIKTLRLHSNVISQRLWEEAEREETSFVLGHLAQCDDYIMAQPNKILHEACRRHKYLEEELFAYADLLSISHLGAQTYTPQANIQQAEDELDRRMRILNRQLIQGQIQSEEKSRMMRDYVLEVRQVYSSILQELMSVIDVKTNQAKTFVSKVSKWEENYITRKQFLGNLRKDYYHAMFSITQAISSLRDVEGTKGSRITLQESIGRLNTIYMLGNSFY